MPLQLNPTDAEKIDRGNKTLFFTFYSIIVKCEELFYKTIKKSNFVKTITQRSYCTIPITSIYQVSTQNVEIWIWFELQSSLKL